MNTEFFIFVDAASPARIASRFATPIDSSVAKAAALYRARAGLCFLGAARIIACVGRLHGLNVEVICSFKRSQTAEDLVRELKGRAALLDDFNRAKFNKKSSGSMCNLSARSAWQPETIAEADAGFARFIDPALTMENQMFLDPDMTFDDLVRTGIRDANMADMCRSMRRAVKPSPSCTIH
ncbi:hypothetical protein [Citreimonas salinaria]|uniref:Uncharacterized protein n=1 Tax=Citreimonas salinaria TaxID=321339 RepID=A0A1H3LYU7_9RHOB|nr:hypothetical protein [Citreimonas salinaria]SDY69622.1 hypothetical protein SAMN05444340_1159 [Citreimonas salinaria]